MLPKVNRPAVGDLGGSQDDADLQERLFRGEKPQVHEIVQAAMLKIGQVSGVVDVALRVQVPITHMDGMREFKGVHAAIIAQNRLHPRPFIAGAA